MNDSQLSHCFHAMSFINAKRERRLFDERCKSREQKGELHGIVWGEEKQILEERFGKQNTELILTCHLSMPCKCGELVMYNGICVRCGERR